MSDSSATPPRDPSDDTRIVGGPVDPADTGDRGFTGYRDPAVPRSDETTPLVPDRGATTVRTERRSRTGAHLTSLVLSVILVPAALVAADYAVVKGWDAGIRNAADTAAPERAMIAAGIAAGCLLVVALLSRLSGLGPFVAGILFGAVPSVLFALAPLDTMKRLLDIKDPYDLFMNGLLTNTILFPLVGGLLIGLGLFGRWRGTKVTTTT